jgi:hypothetical protein
MQIHISIVKQKNTKFSLTLLLRICIREPRKIKGTTLTQESRTWNVGFLSIRCLQVLTPFEKSQEAAMY